MERNKYLVPNIMSEPKQYKEFSKSNKLKFDNINNKIFTKDKLFPCKLLKNINNNYWFDGVRVMPTHDSKQVAEYLYKNTDLWSSSSIRITDGLGTMSRAPVFGVPFQTAVEIAIKKKFIKCQFYLPERQADNLYSSLLFHVNTRKEADKTILQLQMWQFCIDSPEIYYIHAESRDFKSTIFHLDGAKIYLNKTDIKRLFETGNKIKGSDYQKQFRIDGDISLSDFYSIVTKYLPVVELTNEAFNIKN